jgi:hypothetical protein
MLRSRISRRVAGLGSITLVLVSASACASGGGAAAGDDAVSVVARGADRTLGTHTFRFEVTFGADGQTSVMSGVADLDRKLAGSALGAGGTFPPDQLMTEDGKLYQRREFLPRWAAGVITPWALLDGPELLRKAGGPSDGDGASTGPGGRLSGSGFDPTTMLASLRKTADRVERSGRDVVRGVPTTRYAVSFKPERPVPADLPEGLSARDIPVINRAMTIWVDDDGLVRRIDDRTRSALEGESREPSFTSTVEFFDFGIPVDLRLPAPHDVTDITDETPTLSLRTPDPELSKSVRSWSTVTSGTVGRSRWTLERGTSSDGAVCARLRVDPPVQVPAWNGVAPLSQAPAMPGSPPPLPPDPTVTPIAGLLPSSGEPPAVPPVPFPTGRIAGPPADASTVPGVGISCDDVLWSALGVVADAGGLGWIFGSVPPGADQATARLADGTETAVPFHDGLFVVVHPSGSRLVEVAFLRHGQRLLSCQPPPDGAPSEMPPC